MATDSRWSPKSIHVFRGTLRGHNLLIARPSRSPPSRSLRSSQGGGRAGLVESLH
ncbi:hypothetical protein [Nonomuraea dietziae]|uniref:hypothetical protein n=1 Tax=Nonomuraea dietziae TaxID=65515 RepID=UPI0031D447A2